MKQDIPYIKFKSKSPVISGIEIIRLEDIKNKAADLDHSPEKAHQIEFYKLVFYTNGSSEHLIDFVWHKVEKNTLVYLSKGQVNAFKFNENLEGYVILFTEDYLKEQLNKIPNDSVLRLFTTHLFLPKIEIPKNSNTEAYIALLHNEFNRLSGQFNNRNIIDALFLVLFSKIEEIKKDQTNHLKESDKLDLFFNFQAILKREYTISRNADYYARKLSITYKHLNVVCKEIINRTAKQYIDDFIILEAKRKLVNSTIKSTELAYLMGFDESTNFVKYFKKFTGYTPNKFKNVYS